MQELGGVGQAGLDVFLADVRIVVQNLLFGPPSGKKFYDELDSEPSAFDDWFANKDLGVPAMRSRQFIAINWQYTSRPCWDGDKTRYPVLKLFAPGASTFESIVIHG